MNATATVIGWAVMAAGGVYFAAMIVAFCFERAWRSFLKARGFFNIVEAFEALQEKKSRDAATPSPENSDG
jgi:hypothetical protein